MKLICRQAIRINFIYFVRGINGLSEYKHVVYVPFDRVVDIKIHVVRWCSELFLNLPIDVLENYLRDRKSTRLNSSHVRISYAVFCLKKKKKKKTKSKHKKKKTRKRKNQERKDRD